MADADLQHSRSLGFVSLVDTVQNEYQLYIAILPFLVFRDQYIRIAPCHETNLTKEDKTRYCLDYTLIDRLYYVSPSMLMVRVRHRNGKPLYLELTSVCSVDSSKRFMFMTSDPYLFAKVRTSPMADTERFHRLMRDDGHATEDLREGERDRIAWKSAPSLKNIVQWAFVQKSIVFRDQELPVTVERELATFHRFQRVRKAYEYLKSNFTIYARRYMCHVRIRPAFPPVRWKED